MDASPLARLPAELRNRIYEYAFTSQFAVTMQTNMTSSIQPPLTRTCRQIRTEALAMSYSLTLFNAHLGDGPATPLTHWLEAQGSENVLRIAQLNIWDMHNSTMTLLGETATSELLQSHPEQDATKSYVLASIGNIVKGIFSNQYLRDVTLVLREMGLALRRVCINEGSTLPRTGEACTSIIGGSELTFTSWFAVVRLDYFRNSKGEFLRHNGKVLRLPLEPDA